MTVENSKKSFLQYELGLLSLKAALSTRAGDSPIYALSCKEHQRGDVKDSFRDALKSLHNIYNMGGITEADHTSFIESTANAISSKHASALHRNRFRFGVCQKLINVHLKYLWVAGFIPEPPHCPIDGIIRDLAGLNYDWTTSDSREDYESAIAQLQNISGNRTLAAWELEEFRRPAQ